MADYKSAPSSLSSQQIDAFPIPAREPDIGNADVMFGLAWLLLVVGIIAVCFGAYFMATGPEMLYVNMYTGPSLYQLMKLNPAGVATLGFVCIVGAGLVANKGMTSKIAARNRVIEEGLRGNDMDWSDVGSEYKLVLQRLASGKMAIQLLSRSPAGAASRTSTPERTSAAPSKAPAEGSGAQPRVASGSRRAERSRARAERSPDLQVNRVTTSSHVDDVLLPIWQRPDPDFTIKNP